MNGSIPGYDRLIFGMLILLGLASCKSYYQVFEVDSPDIVLYENDYFVDTSSHLHIIYDFWSDGGIPIIEMANADDDTIVVDFKKSYFVLNQDSFAFAAKPQPDSVITFDSDAGYNIMFTGMPGSILLPPDSVFSFEGIAWNYEWSKDVSPNEPNARYVYTSSPVRMQHAFVYGHRSDNDSMQNGHKTDTIIHRMYMSRVSQLDRETYLLRVRSDLLSNKFFISPESGLTEGARMNVAYQLLTLLRSEN